MELRQQAALWWAEPLPERKVQGVLALWAQRSALGVEPDRAFVLGEQAGHPDRPVCVAATEVPRRSPFTAEGHAALAHSIAHIEFNAINLALDAVARFSDMPIEYYTDWFQVAAEEAKHFDALRAHLLTLGHDYGDFPSHDGLWALCHATRNDVAERMALVPRTMEARGLDANPLIQARLQRVASPAARELCDILDMILREEVGHVAVGNRWYRWLCERRGLDPQGFYAQCAARYQAPPPRPPLNMAARLAAGFTPEELESLLGRPK